MLNQTCEIKLLSIDLKKGDLIVLVNGEKDGLRVCGTKGKFVCFM